MKNKHTQVNSSVPVFSTTITSLSHDGRGISSSPQGKTIFIENALLNETVSFRLTKKHKKYNEAETVEILTASPDRVVPPCVHYPVCGGCSLQHMSMPAQIETKQKVLLEQLKHFGRVVPETILPPVTANSWGYRRKARLGVRYLEAEKRAIVGFRQKGSQTLAELHTCLVLHTSVGMHLQALAELVTNLSQPQFIPQIEAAIDDHTSSLIFRHLKEMNAADIEKLQTFGKKLNLAIYLQPDSPSSVHKIWPQDNNTMLAYALPDYDLEMQFHPLDFTQINGDINPLMIRQALSLLELSATDQVLDLFCGLGNFTLPMARHVGFVTGIEGSIEMVERAKKNALHNKMENSDFFAANLDIIPSVRPAWMKKKYDKILLDPPRTGAKEIINIFPKLAARKIVYVSCNPATLARDAGELVHKQGYTLKSAGVLNMFPHTSHIEAMALFEKIKT